MNRPSALPRSCRASSRPRRSTISSRRSGGRARRAATCCASTAYGCIAHPASAMRAAMAGRMPSGRPLRVLEIGCGDGDLLLARCPGSRVAEGRPDPARPRAAGRLRDHARLRDVRLAGAHRHRRRLPVGERPSHWPRFDLVVANLFLHHFEAERLPRCCRRCAALRRARRLRAAPRAAGARGQPPRRRDRRQRGDAQRRGAQRPRRLHRPGDHGALAARGRAGRATDEPPEWQCREYSARPLQPRLHRDAGGGGARG